jgi:hypothetical protein
MWLDVLSVRKMDSDMFEMSEWSMKTSTRNVVLQNGGPWNADPDRDERFRHRGSEQRRSISSRREAPLVETTA